MDSVEVWFLMAVLVNGAFDAIVVAWLAGKRSKKALVTWLQSDEATPYYDQIADRAQARFEPMVANLEAKVAAISPEIAERTENLGENLPSADLISTQLTQQLTALQSQLGQIQTDVQSQLETGLNNLRSSIGGMFGAVRGAEVTGVQQALKKLDGPLNEMEAVAIENIGMALNEGNPMAGLMLQLARDDMTPDFAEEHPVQAQAYRAGKAWLLQQIKQMMPPQQPTNMPVATTVKREFSPFG